MEQGFGSRSNAPPVSIDKYRVLDVKPLRRLVPLFPNPPGMSSVTSPQPTPFVCVPPSGPFPPGVQPFYPFLVPNDTENRSGSHIPAPVPLNSFRTPTPQANGSRARPKRTPRGVVPMEDDEFSASQNQSDQGFNAYGAGSSEKLNARQLRKRRAAENAANGDTFDFDSVVNGILTLFNIKDFDDYRKTNGDKDAAGTVLLMFNLLRRKLTLLDEANELITTRPDLKACNLLMTKGIRANNSKKIGHVPGIEIGDIFFFRMELCLVGIHAPSMAGIDYMSVKASMDEEPVAVSIVSAGGYDDDEGNDGNVLIYTGQGGVQRRDGQMFDQKLERGNLALEKSLHRGNEVRVMRGIKDKSLPGCKIYVYEGLYKIHESWAETNKSGCNVFKYKLVRCPGQPEAFSVWKSIQQWKDGTATRPDVILPDLTSGAESQPVTLVNEVDRDRPAPFTYISALKYSRPFPSSQPSMGCRCVKGCQAGDTNCACNQRNGNSPPYSSLGVLFTDKPLIHECGLSCTCPPTCRSRISQGGVKVRLEVFKTKYRGFGLRSWDPIRAGGFICEYAGEAFTTDDFVNESDSNYTFDATRYFEPLGTVGNDSNAVRKAPFPLVVSARSTGNVARFMNHSCSPNVIWQPVLRENNNESYLHIAFFAIQNIPPMQELTFDYGLVSPEKRDRGKKKCVCGSAKCKGYFY